VHRSPWYARVPRTASCATSRPLAGSYAHVCPTPFPSVAATTRPCASRATSATIGIATSAPSGVVTRTSTIAPPRAYTVSRVVPSASAVRTSRPSASVRAAVARLSASTGSAPLQLGASSSATRKRRSLARTAPEGS
jgi:hypothetical protein